MITSARTLQSDYMHFAKYGAGARYSLASSGVLDCTLADLGVSLDDLALHGPNAGGWAPLVERVAGRFGVDPACVVMPGGGASFANHLVMAALVAPGDEVVVEDPGYELLVSTLGYLQAQVRTFERRPEAGWRLDPERVAQVITPRTRLVVLTNLHNPTGAFADDDAVQRIAAQARAVGAHVLVDEVYRELTFSGDAAQTAFRPGGAVVVTSSLTKAYGLSGLRCGWILAPAPLAERMRRLNDLYGVAPPHVAERLALPAFDRLPALRERALATIEQNRVAYREVLGAHPRLEQTLFDQGATVFPRLIGGDVDVLFARMRAEFDVSFVPGRFFGRPDHMRIGLTGAPEPTRIALERLAAALA